MTTNELRELCMEVRELGIEDGMEQEEKEKVLIALKAFLETQDAGFSGLVLEYATSLAGLNLRRQCCVHIIAMNAAQLPEDKADCVNTFSKALMRKDGKA